MVPNHVCGTLSGRFPTAFPPLTGRLAGLTATPGWLQRPQQYSFQAAFYIYSLLLVFTKYSV
jgi:hypothetical protein